MHNIEQINEAVKAYILKEFLAGEDPEQLTASTALITGGILDSLATLKLVAFIEERYKVELQPYEVDVEFLDTIADISKLVLAKLS
jgi:acyl carrier protein